MGHVLLFHSVLGLRPVERGLADEWRAAGHEVTLPDLYDGPLGPWLSPVEDGLPF